MARRISSRAFFPQAAVHHQRRPIPIAQELVEDPAVLPALAQDQAPAATGEGIEHVLADQFVARLIRDERGEDLLYRGVLRSLVAEIRFPNKELAG